MFALAETMYLCRTLGELLRMHSGCFCYRSNNVWFWKEQGLVSFAEMKCQKCKHFGAHNTPLPKYIYSIVHISNIVGWLYIFILEYIFLNVSTNFLIFHNISTYLYHQQVDDGWPESVEEQRLLLLVWRHNITNNIIKMWYRQSRRGVSRQNSRSVRQ